MAVQVPCRLWQGLDQLRKAMNVILANLKLAPDAHVVTMTGELADIFANRTEGVFADCRRDDGTSWHQDAFLYRLDGHGGWRPGFSIFGGYCFC